MALSRPSLRSWLRSPLPFNTKQWLSHEVRDARVAQFFALQSKYEQQCRAETKPIRVNIVNNSSSRRVPSMVTLPETLAKSIKGLSRSNHVACRVNGVLWDPMRPFEEDCDVEYLSIMDHWDDLQDPCWRASAMYLGASLEEVFGDDIIISSTGLAEREGFVCDAYLRPTCAEDVPETIDHSVMERLTEEMRALVRFDTQLHRIETSVTEAMTLFEHNPFKLHQLQKLAVDGTKTIALYRCGKFVDLVQGPLVGSLRKVDTRIQTLETSSLVSTNTPSDLLISAGIEATNPKLRRVTGISFANKKLAGEWKGRYTVALQNKHTNLGPKLGLFTHHPSAPGAPFFLPHGTRMFNRFLELLRCMYMEHDYEEVITPQVFAQSLWETSGHWTHYREDMFQVQPFAPEEPLDEDDESNEHEVMRGLKPMNCPAHCLVFAHEKVSYAQLPLRLAEFSPLHRNEASGALTGLTRVRQFHQDDAHVFCTRDQIKAEVDGCLNLLAAVYSACGCTYRLSLSTRPDKFVGDAEAWQDAEAQLRACLDDHAIQQNFAPESIAINHKDGAFYGPKIDVYLEDRNGKQHQSATIQLDFQLPERFDLSYTDAEATQQRPVIIHRAILGSVERMMALMIESTGGKMPFWLSPRQVAVLSLGQDYVEAAQELTRALKRQGIYAELDSSNTTVSRKVRKAQSLQFNTMIVVGSEEATTGQYAIRFRDAALNTTSSRTNPQSLLHQRLLEDMDAIVGGENHAVKLTQAQLIKNMLTRVPRGIVSGSTA
eukprot:m.193100 g.193100  ORF g.193100 m.193100 type:complete len:771 (-) comp14876_c0_seq4:327-2639(-)